MKKMMLMGETQAGKSTLIKALSGGQFSSRRAMAVEHFGQFINPPGEFLENRRFYPALITASSDCDILAMIQDATRNARLFPPLFAALFNRKAIEGISKVDAPGANAKRGEFLLKNSGVKEIIRLSSKTGEGLSTLREMLR